jgi:integration host factor subunit beta
VDLSKAQTDAVLTQCFQAIMAALQAGESVELRGFGRFSLRHRQARAGRNPRTGQTIPIPAKAVPTFTAGKAFQEQVQPHAAAGRRVRSTPGMAAAHAITLACGAVADGRLPACWMAC